jgi:serine/threonine protein kinase
MLLVLSLTNVILHKEKRGKVQCSPRKISKMIELVGQQLGNYRLSRLIGHGGFAEVYLGEHIHLNTQAAIKVLQIRLTGSNLEQFRNEARTIASLVHPNIVRVLDFGVEDDIPFLVMDYAPNGTLRQRHPRGVLLPLESIMPYVKQAAAALQYAHDRRLIHRDVKPENMLVGRNEDVLLSDFGLVMIAQSTRSQTTKEMAGTLPYMAPEQINGKPRPASDQYALGIVIYEWLSGERPFQGSFVEIATQHLMTPPAPLHGKVAGISPAVEEVVFTALAKDPQRRFASVHAFAAAFEQACHTPYSASFAPRSIVSRSTETSQSTYVVSSASNTPSIQIPPPGEISQSTIIKTPLDQTPPFTGVVTPSSQPSETAGTVTPHAYSTRSTIKLAPPDQPLTEPTHVSPDEPPPTPLRRHRQLRWFIAAVICAVIIATIAVLPSLLFPNASKSAHSNTTSLTSSSLTSTSKPASPFTPTLKSSALPASNPSATPAPTSVPARPTATPRPPGVNPSTLNFDLTALSGSSTQSLKLSSGSQAESWSVQTDGLPWLNLDVMSGKLNPGQTQLINVTVNPTTLVPGTYTDRITINLSSGGALTVPVTLTVV